MNRAAGKKENTFMRKKAANERFLWNMRFWQGSRQQSMQGAFLLITLFFLCLVTVHLFREKGPREIRIDVDQTALDAPIPLRVQNAASSQVESCTWYVGERQVLRTGEITSYTPKEEDKEHFIRVEVCFRDGSTCEDSFYYSILPVLYLESETEYKGMPRDLESDAYMKLAGGRGTLPTEGYEGEASIRIRGNSTSELSKHPFKLKLEEKADLLGMGASRHWVLLANAIDPTLMRNQLVQEFAKEAGATVWMDSRNVSLVYNGEYQGVYQLSEQVRIGESRVNIYNWEDVCREMAQSIVRTLADQELVEAEEENRIAKLMEEDLAADFSWTEEAVFEFPSLIRLNEEENRQLPARLDLQSYVEDENLPAAAGGVLLEINNYDRMEAPLKTNYEQPFCFNRPYGGGSFPALTDYLKEYLQSLEYALHETDFTYHADEIHYQVSNPGWFDWEGAFDRLGVEYEPAAFRSETYDGVHYSELIDVDSLLRNFLICEFTVNYDGMKNSTFFYKDLEGPLYLDPAWDFDWAWGNSYSDKTIDTWKPEIWQTTDAYFGSEQYFQTVQWNRLLIRDPYFLVLLYEKYWEIRETVIEDMVREGGWIDTYASRLKPAADANDARWDGCRGDFDGQRFDEGTASMKDFLEQRTAWLDAQFASVETLRSSLGYYEVSSEIRVEEIDTVSQRDAARIEVRVDLPECRAVSFQINGTYTAQAEVEDDGTARIWVSRRELRAEKGRLNAVQVRALDEEGNYIINPEGTVEGEYQNAVSHYGYFSF